MQVADADLRLLSWLQRSTRQCCELLKPDGDQHLRQQAAVALLETDAAWDATRLRSHPLRDHTCDVLERAVLQQPCEEQVAGLEQGEVLLVLHLGSRQQPDHLEIEQRRSDHEEARGLVEVPVVTQTLDVGDELVGDPGQGHLGDVELVLGDQLQQKVERSLEVVEGDRESHVDSVDVVSR